MTPPADTIQDPVCRVCSTSLQNHMGHNHDFSLDGQLHAPPAPGPFVDSGNTPTPPPASLNLGLDPILRYVLIEKGIITSDDLTEAEAKLRASGFLSTP